MIGEAVEHSEVSGDGLCLRWSQLLLHVPQMCQTLAESPDMGIFTLSSGIFIILLVTEATLLSENYMTDIS